MSIFPEFLAFKSPKTRPHLFTPPFNLKVDNAEQRGGDV
jgi:hypothetical protein